jgi:hypothetical protein
MSSSRRPILTPPRCVKYLSLKTRSEKLLKKLNHGEKPWLGQKPHVQEVVGSKSMMDVSDASYYTYVDKKKNKGSQSNY